MKVVENSNKLSEYLALMKNEIILENLKGHYNIDRHMENIVKELLNMIFKYELVNKNEEKANYPAIDLADDCKRISVQVTANNSIQKINSTLRTFSNSKENLPEKYDRLIFFMLKGKADKYYKKNLESHTVKFNMDEDIWDYEDIIRETAEFTNAQLVPIVDFLKNQYVDIIKIDLSKVKKIDCNVNEIYISRKFIPITQNNTFNIGSGKDLLDIINNENKIVLLSDAGQGKTECVKKFVNEINEKNIYSFPFYRKLNTYTNQKIEELIPVEYKDIPKQNLVFVFDGLDEIEDVNRLTFVKELEFFCEKNSEIKVIVTSRMNFYKQKNKDFFGTLTKFKEYVFCNISEDEIKELLEKKSIDTERFWTEIARNNLHTLIYNLFYFNKIVSIYEKENSLPQKEVLLDNIIIESFNLDENKFKNSLDLRKQKTENRYILFAFDSCVGNGNVRKKLFKRRRIY